MQVIAVEIPWKEVDRKREMWRAPHTGTELEATRRISKKRY